MEKAHVISVATAFALGLTGSFAANAITAKAATAIQQPEKVHKILSTGAQNSLENIIAQQACSEIDDKHGVGTCIVNSQAECVSFCWVPASGGGTEVFMKADFSVGGTFTPGAPQ